jgi:RNA polymerase sigma-70 factor (ECF subfamily)
MGFDSFFEEHRSKVFGAMCLVTGNRQEAEEITQDAFLRLWERWDRVSEMEDPTGFLFKTANERVPGPGAPGVDRRQKIASLG